MPPIESQSHLNLDPGVYPDTALLVTEDGKPVDNLFVEKQYRLLTEPLWTSWKHPQSRPFRVLANVGLFFAYKEPPLVPDVMFALDVESPRETRVSDNRSYFTWVVGKPPDIVIEIVSDKRGREDSDKLRAYERIKVPIYVVFDPDDVLKSGVLRAFGLNRQAYTPIDPGSFGDMQLGLTLWDGIVEGGEDTWLRWVDHDGNVIPNAEERAAAEKKKSQEAEQRAAAAKMTAQEAEQRAAAAKMTAQEAEQRAAAAQALAEQARIRAEKADERIRHLEAKLKAAGLSANGDSA